MRDGNIDGLWALLVSFMFILFCSFIDGALAAPLEQSTSDTMRTNSTRLVKRFDDARFTFYDAGLGACGEVNSNSDFIVALNIVQWDNRAHCGERITISYGGKTATARITDLCPGCPYGGLDLSRGLFSYFASQDLGVIHGTWNFGSGGGGAAPRPTTTTTRRTTHTPTPTTRSSTTRTRPQSTTSTSTRATPTPTPSSSLTTTRTRSHSASGRTTTSLTESSSVLAEPTPSPAASASRDGEINPDALQKLSFILLKLGAMIVEFANANRRPESS